MPPHRHVIVRVVVVVGTERRAMLFGMFMFVCCGFGGCCLGQWASMKATAEATERVRDLMEETTARYRHHNLLWKLELNVELRSGRRGASSRSGSPRSPASRRRPQTRCEWWRASPQREALPPRQGRASSWARPCRRWAAAVRAASSRTSSRSWHSSTRPACSLTPSSPRRSRKSHLKFEMWVRW